MASGGAVLTIVGGAVFGPAGALVGGILGDILFPPDDIEGPRLNELNFQQSTVGAPIPLVYGTASLAGNVIWSGGLIETKHEDEQGGFLGFGGQKFTSYTYAADVAVGICEGPISGIRRIWADADLIYDASDDATLEERLALESSPFPGITEAILGIRAMSAQLDFEQYLGSEDQLPDPTIEIYEGVGLVPAYRGLAYVVFREFQLEKYGNRIPNFRFEVYSGAATECGLYSAGNLEPWTFNLPGPGNATTNDPRNPDNSHVYSTSAGSPLQEQESYLAAKAAFSAAYNGRNWLFSEALGRDYHDNIYIQGWSDSSSGPFRPCEADPALSDYVTVYMHINSMQERPSDRYGCAGAGGPAYIDVGAACDDYEAMGALDSAKSFYSGGTSRFEARITTGNDPADVFAGAGAAQGADLHGFCADEPVNLYRLTDQQITVSRTLLPPDPCMFGTPLVGAPGWCVVNGQVTRGITWTQVSGTFHCLQKYAHTGNFGAVTAYPVDPCLRSDDPNYNDQDYWEAAYAQALAEGEPIAPGLVYGVDYPETQSYAYFSECDTVDTECVPMAVIVADLCRRAGLT